MSFSAGLRWTLNPEHGDLEGLGDPRASWGPRSVLGTLEGLGDPVVSWGPRSILGTL